MPELATIYQGLMLVIQMDIDDLVCYSDSLRAINPITIDTLRYHTYVVLIQNIKDLLANWNISLLHTLKEENHCDDFLAQFRASLDVDLIIHSERH